MKSPAEYSIEVRGDFLAKQARAQPIQAISELIWNSLDADAQKVEVQVEDSPLGGIQSIRVMDDGMGIPHSSAPQLFSALGGSWKLHSEKTADRERFLHGSEGRGRLKAFAIGSRVKWETTYQDDDGFFTYSISMRAESTKIEITPPEPSKRKKSGTRCIITEIQSSPNSLKTSEAVQALSEIFAFYLKIYPDIRISLPAGRLNPSSVIEFIKSEKLNPIQDGEEKYPAELEIIEWKSNTDRVLYLCNEQGFPLSKTEVRVQAPGLSFSAYLKSRYISELAHEGTLGLEGLAPNLQPAIEQVKASVKQFHKERCLTRAQTVVEKWKQDLVYPYDDRPLQGVDRVKREVFDLVAVQVNDLLPDLSNAQPSSQRFQLRMLRQAIESSPEELELILSEVLNLSDKKRKEFAQLLRETTLSSIISASRLVSDRLKTIAGLDKILYDPDLKVHLKERTQLHRILSDNSWIWGEEYNLMIDDQSLTEALRQHLKANGESQVVDRKVTLHDGGRGILDLMLGQRVPTAREDELEYLVLELKRPSVIIGPKEITQIKEYAYAVAADSRFHDLNARWSFWVLSNEMNDFARMDANRSGVPKGQIYSSDDPRITIWIKTWSEVLMENKKRLSLFRKTLDIQANQDDGLAFLREKHRELNLFPENAIDPEEVEERPA